MPSITTSAQASGLARPGTPKDVVAAIDDLLFDPDGWFAIDRDNRRVPRVVIPTRQAGLDLVGRGQVATIVGRLRPEAAAVDIDLDDSRGTRAVEEVTAWCGQHGLWTLTRPSGAVGHWHVLIVHGVLLDDLRNFVKDLRGRLAASPRQVDLRRTLRPLTAPHRLGGTPTPVFRSRSPAAMLKSLTCALPTSPGQNSRLGRYRPSSVNAVLLPRPRPARPLPEPWERYLRDGIRPTLGGNDHSRSTYEAIATGALVRAGHTAESAWQQILVAHPDVMTKARGNQRRWLKQVWNRAVLDDHALASTATRDPNIVAATAVARAALWRLLPGQRSRTSILRVGLAVLDRMERVGSLRVPVPERDLVLDTGITDRKTIRAALRQLHAHGIGALHTDTLAAGARRAHSSFEFSVRAVRGPEIPPPGSHTPLPPALWSVLPPVAAIFWNYLATKGTPVIPAALLTGTGHTAPGTTGTRHQLRDAIEVLRQLGRIGLVACDEHGAWTAATPDPGEPSLPAAIGAAEQVHQTRQAQIEAERAAYRWRVYSEWGRQRAEAIESDRRRHQAWWDGLGEPEQQRRRANAAKEFVKRSPCDQARDKHRWAVRREADGISEADRHYQWISSIPDDEYRRRSAERARVFAARPWREQWTLVADWDAHRRKFSIGRGHCRRPLLTVSSWLSRGGVEQAVSVIDAMREISWVRSLTRFPGRFLFVDHAAVAAGM